MMVGVIKRLSIFAVACITAVNSGAPNRGKAVVIVDPFSTGALLAARAADRGYECVQVLSTDDPPLGGCSLEGVEPRYDHTINYDENNEDWNAATNEVAEKLKRLPVPLAAVIAGAETGVELAERLAYRLGLRNNGERLTMVRRDKFLMGEQVKKMGVPAAKQMHAKSVAEVESFCDQFEVSPEDDRYILPIVAKPLESCMTDDVFKCYTKGEVLDAFHKIHGKFNGLGRWNDGCILQEFLDGIEYVVDCVSKDGKHRVVAVWEYDKRRVNGANFIYFGTILRDGSAPEMQQLMTYAKQVLDALELRNGPSHMEVKITRNGPRLIEVGARCHGTGGTFVPVVDECLGFNKVDVTLDCYLADGEGTAGTEPFDVPYPKKLNMHGRVVELVSRHDGMVKAVPGLEVIKNMESVVACKLDQGKPGTLIRPTTNLLTAAGMAMQIHEDPEQIEADYAAIRALEVEGLYELEHKLMERNVGEFHVDEEKIHHDHVHDHE